MWPSGFSSFRVFLCFFKKKDHVWNAYHRSWVANVFVHFLIQKVVFRSRRQQTDMLPFSPRYCTYRGCICLGTVLEIATAFQKNCEIPNHWWDWNKNIHEMRNTAICIRLVSYVYPIFQNPFVVYRATLGPSIFFETSHICVCLRHGSLTLPAYNPPHPTTRHLYPPPIDPDLQTRTCQPPPL